MTPDDPSFYADLTKQILLGLPSEDTQDLGMVLHHLWDRVLDNLYVS
jgi:hypothetical protein